MTDDDHRSALLAVVTAADRAFGLDGARTAEEAKWMSPAADRDTNGGWGARPQSESTAPGSPGGRRGLGHDCPQMVLRFGLRGHG
jgi:hypothetical protein